MAVMNHSVVTESVVVLFGSSSSVAVVVAVMTYPAVSVVLVVE